MKLGFTTVLLGFLTAHGMGFSQSAQSAPTISTALAASYFTEASALCTRDGGKLWGVSTCGPMLFVDPSTRQIVASQADAYGALHREGAVFTGQLPDKENVANTAGTWSGTRWSEMIWPLPEELALRDTLIEHELFHRIQDQLKLAEPGTADNAHLDTLEGRYSLELEERALEAALKATTEADREQAIKDALLFRRRRYELFPNAAKQESSLELNEGLAEYTGVRLGNTTAAEQKQMALDDLERQQQASTFVRSFAYGTGPAYGILLDQYAPGWRSRLNAAMSLDSLLKAALDVRFPDDAEEKSAQRAAAYVGPALRKAEVARESLREATIKRYTAEFIDSPTLTLDLTHMQVQFNPQNLQPLGEMGTVYPTIRITDDWGVLQASEGALLKPDWSALVVTAPQSTTESAVSGQGWTLHLTSGWKIISGGRKGDFRLERPATPRTSRTEGPDKSP